MCSRVTCRSCGKPTWSGCGAHVEQVLGHIPKKDRCQCREASSSTSAATSRPFWKIWSA